MHGGVQVEHVASANGGDTLEECTTQAIAQRFGRNSREARGTAEGGTLLQGDGDVRTDGESP